ncbi:MAG: hypothetical protein N3B13_04810 [Deltaproteobacteria bacterium]|nr:hypothetical protein [Deltaproteobacteria bacterium]
MKDRDRKKLIISFVVELMKDEVSYSEIIKRVREKFGLDEVESGEYVKSAFETVSFLEKNTGLTSVERAWVVIAGLITVIGAAYFYSILTIRTGYNLILLHILLAYLISNIIYLVSKRKSGLFLELISAVFVLICYLLGEYLIFINSLVREFSERGISVQSLYQLYFGSVNLFFTGYLFKKSFYELIVVVCAALIASSFFFRIRIRRIRK